MFLGQARRQSFNANEKSMTLTETKPFNLRSEERGRAKQALLEQRLIAQRRQVKYACISSISSPCRLIVA